MEVYLNGKFNGNYLITEAVEAKKERIDIDAYNAESNDILLELGTRNEPDVDHFTTDVLSTTFDVNDPEKGDDLTDAQVDEKIERIKQYLNGFETSLRNQSYEEILQYIDEDSFVNFYIVNELFKNVDFNFSSTRFFVKDNKIYAGPCWDYDLSSGNCKSSYYKDYYVDGVSYKGYYCQNMNWYKQLFRNDTFYNKVKERYRELQYKIQNIYKNDSETIISVKYLVDNYGASFERNYRPENELGAGWFLTNDDGYSYAAESGWKIWQEPIEFLRDWMENRNIWLCDQWGIDMVKAYEESKPVIEAPTTPEATTPEETTPQATGEQNTQKPTTSKVSNMDNKLTAPIKVAKGKVKKAIKKKNAKKIKLIFKKLKNVTKYQVRISSSKKFTKKKTVTKLVKKTKVNLAVKKLRKFKKLYVKVRGVRVVKKIRYFGAWSNRKVIKIK